MKTYWSILAGILLGVLFHYLLYRFSLPAKPFIYVAF
jgi:xanthosine utilization system XapX-like protein